MKCFNCLGMVLTASNNYWLAMVNNMRRSSNKWVRLSSILGREGADAWTSRTFFNAVV